MAVVHGQVGSMFIIIDDGEIDQETEHTRPQEVPEGRSHQKVKRPLINCLIIILTLVY
jgi:hypothetical protein